MISNGEEFPESDGVRVVTELGCYAIHSKRTTRESHNTFNFTIIQMLKTKLPPSKITVPAFAFENIPVGGEHRLVPLTVQTDGLHDGQ